MPKKPGLNVYQRGTAQIDATLQAQLVQDLIAQGVDAICVVPVDLESLEPVLAQARDAGIVVIAHEGADLENVDYDIEAFSNAGYGAFIMDNLAEAMGGEGLYTTMVASLTNGSHNEWANAGVAHQKATYPKMKLLEDEPRVESNDNGDVAYNVSKELFKKYPDLKGVWEPLLMMLRVLPEPFRNWVWLTRLLHPVPVCLLITLNFLRVASSSLLHSGILLLQEKQ